MEDPLSGRYRDVRAATVRLADPLSPEDCQAQSMEEASPVKWHLAHTTWFFDAFVLGPFLRGRKPRDARWGRLFNSYYERVGERIDRPDRGLMTRPGLDEIRDWRGEVDASVARLLESGDLPAGAAGRIELGIQHEQQHQELILTDVKHLLSLNPLRPAYGRGALPASREAVPAPEWIPFDGRVARIGHAGAGFAFDNEGPAHERLVHPFRLASRPVTCGEYLEFMRDGGYRAPTLWMSLGWAAVEAGGWEAPFYWERSGEEWLQFTLHGMRPVDPAEPVCHVSWFEADAFARWAGARLPTEEEWEVAAGRLAVEGNFAESGRFHPAAVPTAGPGTPAGMFGDAWEWTASPYTPYPGYAPPAGAIGEYNGKFMCNQYVLRGGSCATPRPHARATYRNFFPPESRWQFSGIRLARSDGPAPAVAR